MNRDISHITRDLENKKNNDIIYKKDKLLKLFNEDPDLNEILGKKDKRPLNKYTDKNNPTAQELNERNLIIEYNKRVDKKQILPILKLNGINKEVLNFIMFDINDTDTSYYNKAMKVQTLIVMCLVHEDDLDTEYGIVRTDLLSYIVKDLLCWTNSLGNQLKCIDDYAPDSKATYICVMHKARALGNLYFWNKYYRKNNMNKRMKNYVPDEWALEIISESELNMLKELERED